MRRVIMPVLRGLRALASAATLARTDLSDTHRRVFAAHQSLTVSARPDGARAAASSAPGLVLVGYQHYTYPVARGDTLWHIAATWLGNPMRWPEIYHLNQA